MTRYLLNSAVLTAFGTWTYTPLTPDEARVWFGGHRVDCGSAHWDEDTNAYGGCTCGFVPPLSTIGYAETATALAELLGLDPDDVPVNRLQIRMEAGDEALVFRLTLPAGSPRINPADKGQIAGHVEAGHWELGLLRRTA